MDLGTLSPRRRALLDAAVAVTAESGLRGLTHRAVDRHAGVPEGSTSAYLRTRAALLGELAAYVAALATADVEALGAELGQCDGEDADEAVRLTTQLFLRWLDEPDLLLVRLEVTLVASRDPAIRASLAASRAQLDGVVATVLADRHGGTPAELVAEAETLVAALDGVLLAALLKPPQQRRDFVTTAVALLVPNRPGPLHAAAPAGPGPRRASAANAGAGRGR